MFFVDGSGSEWASEVRVGSRLTVTYRLRAEPAAVEARAVALAVEQSVEMPVSAIDDPSVRDGIVGRVEAISPIDEALFEVRIGLAGATVGNDAGQLLSMLFGNSSLQDDVVLHDVELPDEVAIAFGGPHHGIAGLRTRLSAFGRALTCTALKPQGLPPKALANLAKQFAEGGVDIVKDDHGLADQAYSPFAERVAAVAEALQEVAARRGRHILYAPSLSGDLDRLRTQVACARKAGLTTVMVAPMVLGVANVHTLVAENPDIAVLAHPSLGGAARIAPPLLFGKLFRLFGADAVVFPNAGGRFGYSRETCLALADAARGPWQDLRPSFPVPAGGMTQARVPELLDTYGADVVLLIGGALLAAGPRLVAETEAFVARVHGHHYKDVP